MAQQSDPGNHNRSVPDWLRGADSSVDGKVDDEMTPKPEYSRPKELKLNGPDIQEVEVATGDGVRIYLTDGGFVLISPRLRDVHRPDEDLIIEVFPEGIKSIGDAINECPQCVGGPCPAHSVRLQQEQP